MLTIPLINITELFDCTAKGPILLKTANPFNKFFELFAKAEPIVDIFLIALEDDLNCWSSVTKFFKFLVIKGILNASIKIKLSNPLNFTNGTLLRVLPKPTKRLATKFAEIELITLPDPKFIIPFLIDGMYELNIFDNASNGAVLTFAIFENFSAILFNELTVPLARKDESIDPPVPIKLKPFLIFGI